MAIISFKIHCLNPTTYRFSTFKVSCNNLCNIVSAGTAIIYRITFFLLVCILYTARSSVHSFHATPIN